MVKADGYGLGAVPVARRLAAEGCTRFYVARLDEGLQLRTELGAELADAEVLVLDGVGPGLAGELVAAGLTPVLNDLAQVERWAKAAAGAGRALPAALHFDTGMTRLGLPATEAEHLADHPDLLSGLDVVVVMSHLASADVVGSPQPAAQLGRFLRLRERFPMGVASLANSAATALGPEYHFDQIRPGIAVYGGAPQPDRGPSPMAPVVTIEVPVLQVQSVEAGTAVGYGATWQASTPTRLATLALGYADGYPRAGGVDADRQVVIADSRVPVVGRVSMDLVVADVGSLPPDAVAPGTPAQLLGPEMPLEEVAAAAGTIANEILTGLGRRYQRRLLGQPATNEAHSH